MSKPKTSIGSWLSRTFGSSYKTISEKLTAEEHAEFVKDAEKLQPEEEGEEEEGESEEEDETDEESTDPTPKSTDKGANTIEARLTALETNLKNSEAKLKAEQKTNSTLTSKVTELESKLKASEAQNKKLRNSVNPLGDEDLTNSEGEESHLTQADIDARESFKQRQAQA